VSDRWRLPPTRPVRDAFTTWIATADGVRLSARIWIPEGAEADPIPAVLEYIPYRKQDAYRAHDDVWGPTLASYGFAYARVDVRGSGDSEGVLMDEYLDLELEDGVRIIAWLAEQAWCSGKVGMRGMSWGGINTLQIAARRPPALAAIMPMGCLDNRYTDDAHYIGGALGHTNFQWGIGFKVVMAGPPDPEVVGDAWETMWRERLNATPPILRTWLEHQRYDAYWRRGSIREDWAAIRVPTYIVAGWQDTYSNPVERLLANLQCPRKALIGPWGHTYPWAAQPYGLDWAHEEVRWWAHWLKDVPTGIMDEPMLRAFMPYRAPSEVIPAEIPGRWVAEATWPPHTVERTLYLTDGALRDQPGSAEVVTCAGDRIVGLTKPEWLDRSPVDQSPDDARSLVFRSPVVEDDLEILGAPVLKLRVRSDRPVAKLAARLVEVTADGASWLVTYGLLNLTHRDSHAEPQPLVAGESYDVEVTMAAIAHRFRAGSRIGLALSESLWPLVWPSPHVVTLSLTLGETSTLRLPVRPLEGVPADLGIPERRTPPGADGRRPTTMTQPISPGRYRLVLESQPTPALIKATGTMLARGRLEVSELREGDPSSCVWTHRASSSWKRGAWDCAVEATCELRSSAEVFQLTESLTATRDGVVVFDTRTESEIKRDLL
jgi:uncharacterized protein